MCSLSTFTPHTIYTSATSHFVENKADTNARDNYGYTPCDMVYGNYEIQNVASFKVHIIFF